MLSLEPELRLKFPRAGSLSLRFVKTPRAEPRLRLLVFLSGSGSKDFSPRLSRLRLRLGVFSPIDIITYKL